MFTTCFVNSYFDETMFPLLKGEKPNIDERREISQKTSSLSHFDYPINQTEHEIQKIIHLQNIATHLPGAFTKIKKVTKSHIPAVNILTRIDAHVDQSENVNEVKAHLKQG